MTVFDTIFYEFDINSIWKKKITFLVNVLYMLYDLFV
jgi:hypothetical protein